MKKKSLHIETKQIIIDGFNLMYKFEKTHEYMKKSDLKNAMESLISILAQYQKSSGKKIRVYFDGKKEEGLILKSEKIGKIKVYYSIDRIADADIMEFIEYEKHSADYTVITSDKQIISFVQRHKAKVCRSEEFEQLVTETLKQKTYEQEYEEEASAGTLSEEDLSFWEKIFSNK